MKLLHSVTKSKAAFLMSAERMFIEFPNSVYFWTFTFVGVHPDWWYPLRWNEYMKALQQSFGKGYINGLRVVEVHPGQYSHGLHYHCLLNKRLNIHIMKRIGKRYGFGRMSVVKADEQTGLYLSKYLTKENALTAGMRRWGTVGGFRATKVRNIEVDSMLSRNIKWVQNKMEGQHFTYSFFLHLSKQTTRYGEIKDWPVTQCNTIDIRNAKAAHVKDIIPFNPPDDDGINEPKEPAFIYRLRSKIPTSVPGPYGWTTVYLPSKIEQPY